MDPSKSDKDRNLLSYLTGKTPFAEYERHVHTESGGGDSHQVSGQSTAARNMEMVDDLEITGVHPGSGVHVVQIKREPSDPQDPGQVMTSTDVGQAKSSGEVSRVTTSELAAGANEVEMEDDDVIIVDVQTTFKYLKGEITFEEFSAHLEVKDDPDEVPLETAVLEVVTSQDATTGPSTASQSGSSSEIKPKKKHNKSKLPRDLMGLMGEANMRYARGNTEEAMKMCMEIIRMAPSAPEPFQTLSVIYEEQGDLVKCMQYALIAAHLKSDFEEWVNVADKCLDQGDIQQAIKCYDRALKYEPKNIDIWTKRCSLLERVGDKKKALQGYQIIMKLLPTDAADMYLQLGRDVAENHHAAGEVDQAVAVMKTALETHPTAVTPQDVNLLLELYLTQQKFINCVQILIQHCHVCLHYADGTAISASDSSRPPDVPQDKGSPVKCTILEQIPIDLRSKLVICLIHLDYHKCIQAIEDTVISVSPSDVGDLYLDIAEAYMDKGDYKKAHPLLIALVQTENYNLAAVWLKCGECMNAIGDLEGASRAYKQVVDLAPSHLGARVSLASIQQQLGQHEEALAALDTGTSDVQEQIPKVDASLLLHKCSLLFSQGKLEAFIDCAKELLFCHLKRAWNKEGISCIVHNRSVKHRMSHLKAMYGPSFEAQTIAARNMVTQSSVTVDDLWELFIKLCNVLVDQRKYKLFEEITIMNMIQPNFVNDQRMLRELEFICMTACLMNHNGPFAYGFIRDICLENLEENQAWNLFCQVITLSKDLRHNRFCLRLMMKHPEHHALGILNGHNAMIAGTYKHALGEYVSAIKKDPKDPMLSLCVGVTFFHLASQKFAARRNALIVQGCSFLNQYVELRGACQESYYNLGRAMHQIGLLHAATHYYTKALSTPARVTCEEQDKEIFDLSREAAFNLSLIYKASGSHDLACHVIQKYIVI